MPRRSVKMFLSLTVMFFLVSCAGMFEKIFLPEYKPQEVSNKQELWGGFESQGIYELLTDAFLQYEVHFGRILVLVPPRDVPRSHVWEAPPSVSAYESNPEDWPNVKGIVNKGTLIRATRIELWPGTDGGTVEPRGIIIDGPLAGKDVYLSELCNLASAIEFGNFLLPTPHVALLRKTITAEATKSDDNSGADQSCAQK